MKWPFHFRPKKATRDFQITDLPSNRFQVFFDVLKNEHRVLFAVSCLLLLFLLPYLGWNFFLELQMAQISLSASNGSLPLEEANENIAYLTRLSLVAFPLGMSLFSLGLAGASRATKRLCFLEPVFFWDDTKKGIKENALPLLLSTFLFSLLLALFAFLRNWQPDQFFWSLGLAIGLIFLLPVYWFFVAVVSFYRLSYGSAMLLAFRVDFRSYLLFLPFLPFFLAPFAFTFIPDVVLKYLVLVLYLLLFSSLLLLAFFLFSYSRFDRYINAIHYPEMVDKGIHRKKE